MGVSPPKVNGKRASVISSVILIAWQVKIVKVNGNQNPSSENNVNTM